MRLCFLFLFQLLVLAGSVQLKGLVVSIADGDTFTLLTDDKKEVKIRLHGIDTPEKGQDYYQVAKIFLSDLIFQKNVEIEEKDIDRYGRTIGMVYYQNRNINEELLKAGLAWHYKFYDKNPLWSKLEDDARNAKKGLWSLANPVAPWEWRKLKVQ